jgi:hypothetical protein
MNKTSSSKTSSSTIARSVASAMWPDVQQQRKVAPGAYWFSCAGHGGVIGIVDELGLSDEIIQVARDCGLIALVADVNHGNRHRRYCTAAGYNEAELRNLAREYPTRVTLHEVWIGEEDCDWATLAYVNDGVLADTSATRQEARECCERWSNADFVAAVDALDPGVSMFEVVGSMVVSV